MKVKHETSHAPAGEFGDTVASHAPKRVTRSGIEKSRYGLEMASMPTNKSHGSHNKKKKGKMY